MPVLGMTKQDLRLLGNLVRMSLSDRYMGSILGRFWAVMHPLLLLGMYAFIFGFIYKSKLPGAETTFAYAIWLISGFVPYLAIQDSLGGTTSCVLSSSSLVKNVVFKSESLPVAATVVSAVPFAVGLAFLFILLLIDGNYPTWHVVFLIPTIVLQFAFLMGIGLFLSATAVFLRDVVQVIPTATLLIVFFTPIFYTVQMLPAPVRTINFFNPFFQMVQPYRDALLSHTVPNLWGMGYLAMISLVMLYAGFKYYNRLKGYFEMAL
ncbi:MAG: ABC transporter permease [Planctomycetaceae bacterium]|nr:ABC transporter permease [Planctomycetaceae bacterium]